MRVKEGTLLTTLSKYERILGTGDFVERVLRESEGGMGYRIRPAERDKRVRSVMEEECGKEGGG
jgi:hypothetical protein